jgi:hypothetical protein
MKTLATLLMCTSIFMVEAAEKKNLTGTNARATAMASKKNSSPASLHIKDKKRQTEQRKEARNRTENLKEKGEEHFFFRD